MLNEKQLDAISSICDANVKLYGEILNTSERLAYTSTINQCAKEGLEKMISTKRQFQEMCDQNENCVTEKSSPDP
ncbi:hypothetical protein BC941DRAFT_445224 [Chlamydoabsidia padenii]|nr:hypothetical protein BC941DRAFT_445224 [Chlamydoabsidia padenii]